MCLPRSLVHLKREISKKKRKEAKEWVDGKISRKKYRHGQKRGRSQISSKLWRTSDLPLDSTFE